LLHLLLKGVVAVLTIRVRSIDVGDRGESVLATPVHPSSRRRQDVLVSCSRHRAAERRRHSASSVATPSLMSDSLSRHTQICWARLTPSEAYALHVSYTRAYTMSWRCVLTSGSGVDTVITYSHGLHYGPSKSGTVVCTRLLMS